MVLDDMNQTIKCPISDGALFSVSYELDWFIVSEFILKICIILAHQQCDFEKKISQRIFPTQLYFVDSHFKESWLCFSEKTQQEILGKKTELFYHLHNSYVWLNQSTCSYEYVL